MLLSVYHLHARHPLNWLATLLSCVLAALVSRFYNVAKFYVTCHVILCHDMTMCHDMRFISEVLIYHCMRRVISDSLP